MDLRVEVPVPHVPSTKAFLDFDHLSVTASVATPSYPCGIARAELAAKELSFGSKFQYPTYRGAPEGEMSADDEVLLPGGKF